MRSVGNNLKRLREEIGMSQSYVARKMGVHPTAVSQWENGWCHPKMDRIQELAELYHCNISDILEEVPSESQRFNYCLNNMSAEGRKALLAVAETMLRTYPKQ